jgi:hypothetical protein
MAIGEDFVIFSTLHTSGDLVDPPHPATVNESVCSHERAKQRRELM